MRADIEIANAAKKEDIKLIAKKLGIDEKYLVCYGNDKAKISLDIENELENKRNGKLILVTAINPTPAGEGKTTTTVGLGQAFGILEKNSVIALREPSLGPCMGIKGGAAGGGYSQVVPMEEINLHFTGDIHAVSAAHNLLSAMIDNHIHQGNALNIDTRKIVFGRVVDMNDRALRNTVVGLGGTTGGVPRQETYSISVASEVMAILCLASSIKDLKERLGRIIVAYNTSDEPVYASDLKAEGAMTALLKQAIMPNLVQTIENTPVLMHGGPFANIAHGCNSLKATKMGLKLADYTITEAGFGADLGAEKFFDIKSRIGGLNPDAVVLVATVRALKYNGGASKDVLSKPDLDALKNGICNLEKHIENIKSFGMKLVVAINVFADDTKEEIDFIRLFCEKMDVPCKISTGFKDGGKGCVDLAEKVLDLCAGDESVLDFAYDLEDSIEEKIYKVASKIYGASGVNYTKEARESIEKFNKLGFDKLPICIAKTQYSFSDDASKLGRPEGFNLNVQKINVSAGAGFLVILTGAVMTMPGLPKEPAAERIDIDDDGVISGLF